MSSSKYENSFNAVRLLAALQVAYHHAVVHLHVDPLPGFWWVQQLPGVPVFFTVSGYLVFNSLLRLQSVPKFYAHRLARIYPALLVNIALMEIALTLAGQTNAGRWSISQLAEFYAVYGLTANDALGWAASGVNSDLHSMPGFFQMYPSGVLWTLTVELTFYAVIPLFWIARSRIWQTVAIISASIVSFSYQQHIGVNAVTINALPYFWMFGLGMLFRLWEPPAQFATAIPLLLGALMIVIGTRFLAEQLQFLLLCLSAIWIGSTRLLQSETLAQHDISYGTYLYHMLVVTALLNVPPEYHTRWLLFAALALSAVLGLASWMLIERPIVGLVRRSARMHSVVNQRSC